MRFDQVWFRYARRAAWTLRAVDAVAEPGGTVVVLGRNGAGKSTLLQLAAGVLRPVRGTVHDRPPVVGWVPERFPADQPFTTRQYLTRMAEMRGVPDPSAAAGAWIERLLLADHVDGRLSDLSKGTAQKVGLAQALLQQPGLLVLDEPWEGLDATARTLVPEIVAEVTAAGGIVLVSDHRGEITTLPGAVHWTVAESTVHASWAPRDEPADEVIIEIAVSRADADQSVARLRAAGHRVVGLHDPAPVRDPAAPDLAAPDLAAPYSTAPERQTRVAAPDRPSRVAGAPDGPR